MRLQIYILLGHLVLAASVAHAQEKLGFRDEFTGATLAPEFRIINADPDRMTLVEGEYVLVLTHKDYKNGLVYIGQLPADYQIIVRFASLPQYDYQGFDLMLGEGEHSLTFGLFFPAETLKHKIYPPFFYFDKHLGEEVSRLQMEVPHDELRPPFLRITKRGVEYDAAYSFDEVTWKQVGTHVAIRPYQRPTVRTYVGGGEAPESPIRIDSFEVIDTSE